MNVVCRRPWHRFVAVCAVLLFPAAGCGDVLGPETMPVASVDGKVSQRGKPVTRGWIEFVPVDGTVGRMRSARLHSDGTFHATKVPVGLNLIRLVNIDWDPIWFKRTFGAFTSPIRRVIRENDNPPLEIDIFMEYADLPRLAPKGKTGRPPDAGGER
jgi:hypothetical protein